MSIKLKDTIYDLINNSDKLDGKDSSAFSLTSHTHSQYLTSHQSIYNLTLSAGKFSSKTYDPNSSSQTVNIPTHTSHLTNDSGFITSVSGNYLPLTGGSLTGELLITKDLANLLTLKRSRDGAGAFIDYYPNNQTDTYWRVGAESSIEFGFLPNGNSNANHVSISYEGHLNVGASINQSTPGRAEISVVSLTNVPCDIMLGSSATKHWSITSRDTSMNNDLCIHSYLGPYTVFEIAHTGATRIGKNTSWSNVNSNYMLDVLGTMRTSSIYGVSSTNLALISVSGSNVELQANGAAAGYKVCLDVTTQSLRPFTDSAGLINLGSSNIPWKNLYAQKGIFKISTADIISLYRTQSGGGAWIDYYANNQTTKKWRVGAQSESTFAFENQNGGISARIVHNTTTGNRFEVGKDFLSIESTGTNVDRAVMTLISEKDAPTDIIMGANRYSWSITTRDSSMNYSLIFYSRDTQGYVMTLTNTGKVGICTHTPEKILDVSGSIGCSTFYIGGEQITFTT